MKLFLAITVSVLTFFDTSQMAFAERSYSPCTDELVKRIKTGDQEAVAIALDMKSALKYAVEEAKREEQRLLAKYPGQTLEQIKAVLDLDPEYISKDFYRTLKVIDLSFLGSKNMEVSDIFGETEACILALGANSK